MTDKIPIGQNILGLRYRLGDEIYTVFETTKTDVYSIPLRGTLNSSRVDKESVFRNFFRDGTASIVNKGPTYSKDMLSETGKKKFERDYSFIRSVENTYGSFAILKGKASKSDFYKLIEEARISPCTAWRLINRYLKGGCTEQALFNPKYFSKQGPAISGAKRGRKSENEQGVNPSEDLQNHFEWALNEWKDNKYKTFKNVYRMMLKVFYSYIDENGNLSICPKSQVPTMKQFRYYCDMHLTQKERLIAKTSLREFENNKRVLLSNELSEAKRPFSRLQADAFEVGIYLVSDEDETQCIGKPTVYTLSDVYSRMIVSAVPGLEVNSNQGLCDSLVDLMLTNHTEMLHNLGYKEFNEDLWPSFIKPDRINCDRGAEYRSDYFNTVCKRLRIEKSLEPPAMGSGKGIVERSYRDFSDFHKSIFADFGATNHEYGDNGRKTATMTVAGFKKVLARWVLYHNEKVNTKYPMDEGMIREGVEPSPVKLYRYGLRFGNYAKVSDATMQSVFYDLMEEKVANITREGVIFEGLYYRPMNDSWLMERIQRAQGNGKQRHPDGTKFNDLTVRYDFHEISHLYYMNESGEIRSMILNPNKSRFNPKLSWAEYRELKSKKNGIIRRSEYKNDLKAIEAERYTSSVIEKNRRKTYATEGGVREARAENKSRLSQERSFANNSDFIATLDSEKPDEVQKTATPESHVATYNSNDMPIWL